ncbi:MAG: exo-alpha-sialidase [Flammeovirgaceae bacterium]|nr:exo-alpha-sialidase [Flammeovirgaceae bacterium]
MNKLLYFCFMLIGIGCSTDRRANSEMIHVNSLSGPATSPAAEPFLFTDSKNQVYLSWIEKQDTINYFKFSRLENNQWTEPTKIASGSSWFVNWADYPMLAVNNNNFLAHYLERSGTSTYAYDVALVKSLDGNDWSKPFLLNTDGKQAEHGFVTILPYGDNFFIAWLDGRNTVMEGMEGDQHNGHQGAMSLRAAVIDTNGNRLNEWELDNKTCDCCQTTAAITSNGPVVVYRDRSDEEIRDMSIVRLINNEWTKPQPVHEDRWKIAGCPVNGPRISNYENTLAVAWFTAASDSAHVNVSFSSGWWRHF